MKPAGYGHLGKAKSAGDAHQSCLNQESLYQAFNHTYGNCDDSFKIIILYLHGIVRLYVWISVNLQQLQRNSVMM